MSTKICAGCGNVLQEWMHGQCATCQRNEQEYKRYGRRRPLPTAKPVRQRAAPKPKPTTQKTYHKGRRQCPICDKTVRTDRYFGHMWHAHDVSPYASNQEMAQARRAWRESRTAEKAPEPPAAPTASKPRPVSCAICGAPIAPERLSRHLARHESRRAQFDHRLLHRGMNALLQAVYEQPCLLSDVLRAGGVTAAEMALLRGPRRACFLEAVAGQWRALLRRLLTPWRCDIVVCRYSLDGAAPCPVAQLAREYREPEPKIRLLAGSALILLRRPANRQQLAAKVIVAARRCL